MINYSSKCQIYSEIQSVIKIDVIKKDFFFYKTSNKVHTLHLPF